MSIVKFVRAGSKGRVTVGVTDGEDEKILSVSNEVFEQFYYIRRGQEIDDSILSVFLDDDEKHKALKKALYLLSYSDKNSRTLYFKLLQHGFKSEYADLAVKECLRLGYIDEIRQLERLILEEANRNLKGPRHIVAKFLQKGYKSSDINAVLQRLKDDGEIDFKENLKRLLEKKKAVTYEEKKAIAYKNGF